MRFAALLTAVAAVLLMGSGSASAVSGKASFYTDKGLGACGTSIDANSQMLVAAPKGLWTSSNPNNDPLCNKKIKVTYQGKSITVPIKDQCPSCDNSKIDLSRPAFAKLGNTDLGILEPVTWQIS